MEDRIKTSVQEEDKAVHTPSAAILIPVVRDKDEPALLMEVRSLSVRQPGEVCFPGGHIEAGETCIDTALRESYEFQWHILFSRYILSNKSEKRW